MLSNNELLVLMQYGFEPKNSLKTASKKDSKRASKRASAGPSHTPRNRPGGCPTALRTMALKALGL